jgi:hypothetical protein
VRANAAAIGVIAALVFGVGVGSGAQGPRTTSWADANHGWRVWPEPSSSCCFVQSTENGGRSWHTIFPRDGNNGLGILRLSRLSGLVSVFFSAPIQTPTGRATTDATGTARARGSSAFRMQVADASFTPGTPGS